MKKAVTCAQCGTKMRAGIKFCSKCGYRLRDPEAEALAEAAQAQEAAANLLTEEEIAAIRAAELASEAGESAASDAVPAEEEIVLPTEAQMQLDLAKREMTAVLDSAEVSLVKESAKAEIDAVKRGSKADLAIARVKGAITSHRQKSEDAVRTREVMLEKASAEAEAKAALRAKDAEKKRLEAETKAAARAAASEARLAKLQVGEEKKIAKRVAETERTRIVVDEKIARLRADEEKKSAKRTADSELERLTAEAKASKAAAATAAKITRMQTVEREKAARRIASAETARLTAESKASARAADSAERLAKLRVTEDERAAKLHASAQLRNFREETRNARAVAAGLRKEEEKEARFRREEASVQVSERRAENLLRKKRLESDRKIRKRREADLRRIAAKQASIRERENKRLGNVQYKAAALTGDAAEARRLADQAEFDRQKRMHEDKIAAREVKAEKRLIRVRAGDLYKQSRKKVSLREKETRALGRAEQKSLRVAKTEDALAIQRKADEVQLLTSEKALDVKRYKKGLDADRKLVKARASDADKLMKQEVKIKKLLQVAKNMEETRASRIRTDDSERAVLTQKEQNKLYNEKKSAGAKLAEREHKLELRAIKISASRDERVVSMKEKEQSRNLKLAKRYEKEALKRAKKISKISGAPVSLVPALAGETPSYALLTSVDSVDGRPVPTLRDPDTLLAKSYESNEEQYKAYKKARKKKEKRLRYVEIGVRNDKKYFDTLYEGGEVMVAKRTVRIARAQAVIAIVLMLVALVGSILPAFTLKDGVALPAEYRQIILDDQRAICFDSILTVGTPEDLTAIEYLKGLLAKYTGANIVASVTSGVTSVATAVTTAISEKTFVPNLGIWVVLLLMSVAILLTPIVILLNIVIAIFRVLFRFRGKSVAITRVMRNLRASYTMLGFYVVPVLLSITKIHLGFIVYAGSFGLAILLNVILNLCKKYEKGDRKYANASRLCGLVRLGVLVGFLFVMLKLSGLFQVTSIGAEGLFKIVVIVFLACSYVFTVFCSRAITTLGFEVLGYTNKQSGKHATMVVFGALAGVFGGLAAMLGSLSPAPNMIMAFAGAGAMVGFVVVTVIFGLVKLIIEKRHSMLDPIIHAIGEGYPLK